MFEICFSEFFENPMYSNFKIMLSPGSSLKKVSLGNGRVLLNIDTKVAFIFTV